MVKIQVDSLGKAIMLGNKALEATGGGGEVEGFLVQVIDYDGTVLKKEILNEGATFTLPSTPTHMGLVFDGWSSPVTITNNTVTVVDQDITIGPMFHTASGLSEFDITLTEVTGLDVTLNMNGTKNWGDGTTDTLTTHTYASAGDYTITCNGSTMTTSTSSGLFGQSSSAKNYYVKNVRFGSSVTSIGNGAFFECRSVTSVTMPSSVISIGSSAFNGCYALIAFIIPSSITSIGASAFQSCYSMMSVVIPNSLTTIVSGILSGCYSLESITIPSGITSIGQGAFYQCRSIKSIAIPDGVTDISGSQIFQNCSSLVNITIPSSITSSVQLTGCSSLKSVIFPSQVTFIVCDGCYALESVTIPSGITGIQGQAFQNCYSLANIDIPDSVTTISYRAFANCYSLTSIHIPNGVSIIYNNTFLNCYSLTKVEVPSSITRIETCAFQNCYSITEYDFSNHIAVPILSDTDAFSEINKTCKIKVPWNLYQEWITTTNWSTYADYIDGGTPATLNFTVTPNNSLIFVNGSQIQGTSTSWVGSVAPYIVYDPTNNVVLSSQQTGITEGSTVNITVDLTNSNKITLSTGVTGLSVIATKDGLTLPMVEESSGNYSVNVVGSGTIVDYYINGGSNYMDVSGSITTTGSDITEVITLIPAVESTFVRPNLTADGTLGGGSFAVKDVGAGTSTSTYAWRAVDNSATTYWNGNTPYSGNKTYVFYNPDALKVSELAYTYTSTTYRATAVSIEGSNDNSTWEAIVSTYSGSSTAYTSTLTNNKFYKYYKLTFTPYSSYVRIYDIAITATYKAPAS